MDELGLENLKYGIISQAADDYLELIAEFRKPTSDCNLEECREFFYSRWFAMLCSVKPDYIIGILERRAKFMITMRYDVRKEHGSNHWYVVEAENPAPIPGTHGSKKQALHKAAELNGVDYKYYMKMRKRDHI